MNVVNLLGHNIQVPGAGNGHAGIIDVLNLTVHRWHKMAYSSFSGLPLPSVAIRTSVVKVTLSPSVKVTGLVNRTISSEKGRGWRGKKNPKQIHGRPGKRKSMGREAYFCIRRKLYWGRQGNAGKKISLEHLSEKYQ